MARKRQMTTEELFNRINGILKEKGKLPDILDYGLATHNPVPITNYEYGLRSKLDYGGNEGIYLDLWMEYTVDGKRCARDLGTFKTLSTDDEAMHIMAALLADFIIEEYAYVTRIENYPEKCFYWESGKEPLYFESKRSADDYAFGMLLNGYPAVVMEVPKAIIINNTKKSRNPKGYLYGVKNRHKK